MDSGHAVLLPGLPGFRILFRRLVLKIAETLGNWICTVFQIKTWGVPQQVVSQRQSCWALPELFIVRQMTWLKILAKEILRLFSFLKQGFLPAPSRLLNSAPNDF
jgi:hypothetical protein